MNIVLYTTFCPKCKVLEKKLQQKDIVYEVVADVDGLNKFTSTNPAQGDGKWIGLAVDTGEQDITKVKYDGNAFTVADVAEAASIGVPAGSFVLWLDAEDLEIEDRTIVLSTDNKADTTILIKLA